MLNVWNASRIADEHAEDEAKSRGTHQVILAHKMRKKCDFDTHRKIGGWVGKWVATLSVQRAWLCVIQWATFLFFEAAPNANMPPFESCRVRRQGMYAEVAADARLLGNSRHFT